MTDKSVKKTTEISKKRQKFQLFKKIEKKIKIFYFLFQKTTQLAELSRFNLLLGGEAKKNLTKKALCEFLSFFETQLKKDFGFCRFSGTLWWKDDFIRSIRGHVLILGHFVRF